MDPRRTSRSSKYRKTAFAKSVIFNLKNNIFRVLWALKTRIRSSRRLSRGIWRAFKTWRNWPDVFDCFDRFWGRFGTQHGPQHLQQNSKEWLNIRTASREQKLRAKSETSKGWALFLSLSLCAEIKGRDMGALFSLHRRSKGKTKTNWKNGKQHLKRCPTNVT